MTKIQLNKLNKIHDRILNLNHMPEGFDKSVEVLKIASNVMMVFIKDFNRIERAPVELPDIFSEYEMLDSENHYVN